MKRRACAQIEPGRYHRICGLESCGEAAATLHDGLTARGRRAFGFARTRRHRPEGGPDVIKMRTNGSSQRWRPTGLEAVLTLRSRHMSDRLPRFWANFARGYR